MRKKITSRLPKCWSANPDCRATHEADLKPPGSRLALKVLVFKNIRDVNHMLRHMLGKGTVEKECRGLVCNLAVMHEKWGKGGLEAQYTGVDANYFAVMCLLEKHLQTDIIVHESVHAGFAYAKRVRNDWDGRALDFDEEQVCYPAGETAAALNIWLHKVGLLKETT